VSTESGEGQACSWGRKAFPDLADELKDRFLSTSLRIVRIETGNPDEARDLFVRLQSGMPLNSQEKRDAWPGQFTDFVLRLGGKPGLARYPGNDFFNVLMRAQKVKDRGKFRQLAAQVAMLYFTRRVKGEAVFCDINAEAIDDFYYENLGFDSETPEAKRLCEILDKICHLLRDQKRPKIIGHEAIHLVLLVDTLWDEYTRSWEGRFALAFDEFREKLALAKETRNSGRPDKYWLRYGQHTRVSSDRVEAVSRRHEFFCEKMRELLELQMKDSKRVFGPLEREILYYREAKKCAVCDSEVIWPEVDIHHIEQHSKGGPTVLSNAALVHSHCHPKGAAAEEFAKSWRERSKAKKNLDDILSSNFEEGEEDGEVS
jgi:HNH endonuclease